MTVEVRKPRLMPPLAGGFPAENTNPLRKREREYCLQWCRAALGTYNALPDDAIGYRSVTRYNKIRKYAQGRQDLDYYEDILQPEQDSDLNSMTKLMVDNRIFQAIPKVRRDVIALIKKANENYDITIDPIDPRAASEIIDKIAGVKARIALRQVLPAAGMGALVNSPALAQQPGEPEDMDGAEVASLGMRHEAAMKAELVVDAVANGNKLDELLEHVYADLVDFGVAAIKDDTSGCFIPLRKVDMRGFVCNACSQPDFSDLRYAGELRLVPIAELVAATANSEQPVSKEELEQIYKLGGNAGDVFIATGVSSTWTDMYLRGKVKVLDLEWISTDLDRREEGTDSYGNPTFTKTAKKPREQADKGVKYRQKAVQNLYRAKWVVGTDIVFDYGLARSVKFDPRNASRVKMSYHIVAGDVDGMIAHSITEMLIPFADSIQLDRMKLQHNLNTAVPNGSTIDLSGLEEIAISAGGEAKMTVKDILALYYSRGDLLWRSDILTGDGKAAPPVMPRQTDIQGLIAAYAGDILSNLEMMNRVVGLNDVTDSSAPNPKRSNPATAAAISGTNNALSHMFSAARRLNISTSEGVLLRAQDMFRNGRGEAFSAALGTKTVAFLKDAPFIDTFRFGVRVDDRPSPEQVQSFADDLRAALESGQITIADKEEVLAMGNLKQRRQYLVYRVRKNADDAQKKALELQQQNGQVQMQSAQAAEQAKQQTLQLEYQLKSQLSQQEHQQAMVFGQQSILGRNEAERIAATGRIDASYVQAKGRDASNMRDNTTALIKEGIQPDTGKIDIAADLNTPVDPLTSEQRPEVPGIADLQKQQFSFLSPPSAAPPQMPPAQAPAQDEPEPQMPPEQPEGGPAELSPDDAAAQQVMAMLGEQ